MFVRFLLATLVASLVATGAWAEPVGSVTRVRGACHAFAHGASRPLQPGAAVEPGDVLTTGDDARLEVRFDDATTLTLGASAEMTVDSFVYAPREERGRALFKLAAGAFLMETGAVGKLPGHPLSVTTPVATIGIRGTKFWGGELDRAFSVLLLDGAVTVTTAQGAVDLARPGVGTTLVNGVPAPALEWSDDRRDRAFATVSFR
jgi:hypothetical protein